MTSTVVIATYNGEKHIEEQIKSVIQQTRRPDCIIVSDDGSSDNTVKICEDILKNSQFVKGYKIIKNNRSLGVTQNFLCATECAQTDVVFFCDQDDIWKKDKIQKVMKVFESFNNCKAVLSDAHIWDGRNHTIETADNQMRLMKKNKELLHINMYGEINRDSFWKITIDKNIATGMCMAISRDVIIEASKIISNASRSSLLMFHDSYYNIVAGSLGEVFFLDEPLAYYRQHDNNVEGALYKFSFKQIFRAKDRIQKSFLKASERIHLIEEMDRKYSMLSLENKDCLRKTKSFEKKRELYIRGRHPVKLIRLIMNNTERYNSKKLVIRDIFVSIVGVD